MPELIDMTGRRFGRLVVLTRLPPHNKKTWWMCRCECGTKKAIMADKLNRGETKSCGCLRSAVLRDIRTTHGHAQSRIEERQKSPTYVSWIAMRRRCQPNYFDARYYHEKGVAVCERWQSFENFLADMGERPHRTSLDRWPDSNGNYEPGNCRWATPIEQRGNRRDVKSRREPA